MDKPKTNTPNHPGRSRSNAEHPDIPGYSRWTKKQKEGLEYLLTTPGKDELETYKRLIGMRPLEVRKTLIDEFIRRYGLDAYADEIKKGFAAAKSWQGLDRAIAIFAGAVGVDEHQEFWDRMRYVVYALPKRGGAKSEYSGGSAAKTTRPDTGWSYSMCKLCWRAVPYNPKARGKRGGHCFLHDLQSDHPTYRKHLRLSRNVRVEAHLVAGKLVAVLDGLSDDENNKTILALLTTPNEILPHLVEYLKRVGHDGTPESLLWAFHGPKSDVENAPSYYKKAVEEYIWGFLNPEEWTRRHERKFNVKIPADWKPSFFDRPTLCYAEAWLAVLGRDGRRKKT